MNTDFQLVRKIAEDKLGELYEATQMDPRTDIFLKIYSRSTVSPAWISAMEATSLEVPEVVLYSDANALYAVIPNLESGLAALKKLEGLVGHSGILPVRTGETPVLPNADTRTPNHKPQTPNPEPQTTNPEPQTPNRKSFKWLVIAFIVVVVLGFGVAVLQNMLVRYMSAIEEVSVPDVRHRSLAKALTILQTVGLEGVVVAQVQSRGEVSGNIVSVLPSPGQRVKTGRKIRLTVSQGPAQNQVPDLMGRDPEQVRIILEKLGLRLAIDSSQAVFDKSISRGKILQQDVSPNTEAQAGTTINVVLSRGFPVNLSIHAQGANSENASVKLQCWVPDDWSESEIRIFTTLPPAERTLLLTQTLAPMTSLTKEFTADSRTIIEVYYDEELALKQKLIP
jgi:hypothetical protein